MHYQLATLGEPRVERDGDPIEIPMGKPLALLVCLAVSPRAVPRSELAALLWPGVDDDRARHSLRQALSVLRECLDPDLITGEEPIGVDRARISTDVAHVRLALADGRLDDALALWQGPFVARRLLDNAPEFDRWVGDVRAELERELGLCLERRGVRGRGVPDPDAFVPGARS